MLRNWCFRRWVRALEDWDDAGRRQRACEKLGLLGDERAGIPLITRLMFDHKAGVRRAACTALGALQYLSAVFSLIEALGDCEARVRRAACAALIAIGPGSIVPLIEQLGNHEAEVRQAACAVLEELGEGRLAQAVLGALGGQEGAQQELAHLAATGDLRAVVPLIEELRNLEARVRQAACVALIAIGPPSVTSLFERLEDPDTDVRQAACRALTSITAPLEPHLKQLLCRSCLARFERKTCSVGMFTSAHFVVCRLCQGATEAVLDVREVISVLDAEMQQAFEHSNGVARVNWLQR
jgi:HEAT repeat protein